MHSQKNKKKKRNILNQKGQAAATDALIFLSIVAIVFVLILGYSMNYGLSIMDSTKKLYNTNYHYAALKAFMSASYGRDGNDPMTASEPITDSVATMIKEDYGANEKVSVQTQMAMFGILEELFLPLPQRSYLLLITHEANPTSGGTVLTPLIVLVRGVDEDGINKDFICNPTENSQIEAFLASHSLDLQIVEGQFIFYRNVLKSDITKEGGQIFLASWVSLYNEGNEEKGKISEADLLTNLGCSPQPFSP
ncbi:MAG: hypothetical protein COT14_01090 [Candidatus Diapherotrites archaeon CG08_land_8_20_14_0_20_30_16]|nr:MAG: hypothetical protein COT14_01090 [Candidatus Diapherotrites archaeon CG08_land_8_20_14_0_20_30_16]